jgi:hypothetical protein
MKNITLLLASCFLFLASESYSQCIEGNCFDGNGKQIFKNGDMYNGLWVKGKMNGQGSYTWKNGDVYKGAFVDGEMEGRGTMIWSNGDRYIGTWEANKMQGRGHYIWETPGDAMSQNKFEGDWIDGAQRFNEVQPVGEVEQKED